MISYHFEEKELNCYKNNVKLKNPRYKIGMTSEQLLELEKIYFEPIYFIRNYMKIVTLDDVIQNFDLYPYQEEFINGCMNERFVISMMARQMGKCVTGDTKIKLRNKKSKQVIGTTFDEFYDLCKDQSQ